MKRKLRFLMLVLPWLFLSLSANPASDDDFIRKNFKGIDRERIPDTLISLSARYAEENPDTALLLGKLALYLGRSMNDPDVTARASRCVAEALFYRYEYLQAADYYMKSADAEYTLKQDSNFFVADRISDAAYCYQELGIYEKALDLYQVSLRINQKLGVPEEIATVLANIGTNHVLRGQYDQAIGFYEQALAIDRQRNDSAAISISLNNIGMLYSRWGNHESALKFYTEALDYTPEESRKAIRYSNIGMSWYHLKDYDKALGYLNKALEIDVKYKMKVRIGIRKNEIANILSAKGQYKEALRLNEEALQIFRDADIRESAIIALADLGDIYRKTGNMARAEACYQESARLAAENGSLSHLIRDYRNLFEIAENKRDFKKALTYFRQYAAIKDSVFTTEKHKQIARFEVLYETEKKEKVNQLLLLDNELKQKRQRIAILIIAGLIVILVLLVFMYRIKSRNLRQSKLLLKQEQELAKLELQKKEAEKRILEDSVFAEKQINRLEREKHQAEIHHKNTELANSTVYLVNKNEILSEIREKLKTDHSPDTIPDLLRFINANTDTDNQWHKFRMTFEELHPGFFDRLQSSHPALTDHDIRLAAYLRVNLSSREIARLMNVSLDATNKARQRLRKKLTLEAEADLAGFLKSI